MHIYRIHIEGFKRLKNFGLDLNPSLNVIVGDNETGKSTVLEAVGLVLTGEYDGRLIQYAIDPYLFNAEAVIEYFEKRRRGENCSPPRILIEAYLVNDSNDPVVARLLGSNNSRNENCHGLSLEIRVDDGLAEEISSYAHDESNPTVLPVDFYRVFWRSFDGNGFNPRSLPSLAAIIDTSLARVFHGPNRYVTQVARDELSDEERRKLSLAYKQLCHGFTQHPGVATINQRLREKGSLLNAKNLTVNIDMSRSSWDSAMTAHLDDLPFDCAGKGEQCRMQMRLEIARAEKSRVVLIEEPENHLSHSNLNMLMNAIRKDCGDRQVIVVTHSAFVLNKLGIDNLHLLSHAGQPAALTKLTQATKDYFLKLPGYDTLRLILSRRAILVEGPSDELIVQRAYKDKHGKLPLEDGVDVISVGTASKRFLEITALLELDVRVVTDNDGEVAKLQQKYIGYLNGEHPKIKICYDDDPECRTLEPQLLKANSLETLNKILGKSFENKTKLLDYMTEHKTECALKFLEPKVEWVAPDYIKHAIE